MTKVNGYKINRGRSLTGYFGTCFSATWQGHYDTPFIAAVGIPSEGTIEHNMLIGHVSPGLTAIHLGYYDDSRKAAYVASMYQEDPVGMIQQWLDNDKQIKVEFPKELFDLPEYLTLADAQRLLANRGTKIKTKAKIKVAVPKVKTQEQLNRAAAMDAVFARKDALAAARAKELVMERVTNYARNKIKNLDTSVQKTILAALAGQRVRDLVSDYESGQRVVNVMIANAKSKAVA